MTKPESYCIKCGASLESNNNFCTKCGTVIITNQESTNEKSEFISKSHKRSPFWYLLPIIVGLVGGIFGIVGGIIAYFILKSSDPKKAKYCLIIGIIFTVAGLILGALVPLLFPDFTQMLEDFGFKIGFNIGENLF